MSPSRTPTELARRVLSFAEHLSLPEILWLNISKFLFACHEKDNINWYYSCIFSRNVRNNQWQS